MPVTPQEDAEFADTDEVVDQPTEVSETEGESAELTNDEVEDEGAGDESPTGDDVSEQDAEEDQPRYTITLPGGEEVEVTLDEMRRGYLRQSDYTRKTQEVAEARRRLNALEQLADALENDPKGTLQALQTAFAEQADADDLEELDPVEARLRAHDAFIQRQEAEARQAQIIAEATQALQAHQLPQAQYTPKAGPNAGIVLKGPDALLQFAIDHRVLDLSVAAELLKVKQPKAAAKRVTVEQKRAAAVIEGGRSKAPATTVPANAKAKKMTLKEAFEAAKAAHQS